MRKLKRHLGNVNDNWKAKNDAKCSGNGDRAFAIGNQDFMLSYPLTPHPRLTDEKTGLTSGVSADVMSRAQTVKALVNRCSRIQKGRYQPPTGYETCWRT